MIERIATQLLKRRIIAPSKDVRATHTTSNLQNLQSVIK